MDADVNGMVVESGREGNEEVFNKEVLQETIHKGKGAYGGADLLRQHHTRSAATYPFLVRPVLSTIGHIMIGYVLLVGFFWWFEMILWRRTQTRAQWSLWLMAISHGCTIM